MLRFLPITLLLALIIALPVSAAQTRVYDLQHHQGHELAEPVRALLPANARVSAFRNHLVVVAEPDELAQIDAVITRMDRPRRMLRISIDQSRQQAGVASERAASGRIGNGDIQLRIDRPGQAPHEGATLTMGSESGHLRLQASDTETRSVRSASQFLVVMEGESGRISVGRAIPYTERWLELARRHARVVETLRFQHVDTGFFVDPEVYGDQVDLAIRPFMAFLDGRQRREISFQELDTRVRIPLGEWFDLAGHMAGQDDVSRAILASGSDSRSEGGTVRVRVDLQ